MCLGYLSTLEVHAFASPPQTKNMNISFGSFNHSLANAIMSRVCLYFIDIP